MNSRRWQADTLFQSVAVAVALSVVCRFVAFGRGVVLARSLAPDELGMWALIANAVQVLAFVCALGVPNGLARYTERFRLQGRLASFLFTSVMRTLAISCLFCLLGFLFWRPTGDLLFGESGSRSLVWLTLAGVAVTVLLSLSQGMLQGLRLFRINSIVELGQNLTFLALAVVLLSCWRSDAYAAAWANLATTLLAAGFLIWWLRGSTRDDKVTPSDHLTAGTKIGWWTVLAYSLGAWGAGSMQALWRIIDRYMLLHLSSAGSAETLDHIGQYFIASKLGQPLGALAGVLSMALLPHAAKLWESDQRTEVADMLRSTTKLAALAMTFGGALLIIWKSQLIELVMGRGAIMAAAVFAPVLVTVVAVSLHFILRTYLMCRERALWVAAIWFVTLLANAVLNAVLIPRFELMGAAWATLISAGLALTLTTLLTAISGMRFGIGLCACLCLPCALLLPIPALLLLLTLVAATVHYSDWLLSQSEKEWINSWCAERFGAYFSSRSLKPQAS